MARPSATASAVLSSRILFEGRGMRVSDNLENNPGDDRLFRWRDYCGRLTTSAVGTLCTYRTAEDVRITANKEVISPSPSALCAIAPIPGPSEQLFAHGISRFPALCRSAAGRAEAYERALAVSLPFLPTPAVSPPPAEPTSRSCPVRSNLQLRDRRRYRR